MTALPVTDDRAVTAPQLANLLETMVRLNMPAFAWGAPGIGKSQVINALAQRLGMTVCDIRLSMFDPVDLRGLPAIVAGLTQWIRPQIWPAADAGPTLLFFDECDRAAPAVQNAALQIVLDRKIGEHVLPASTRVLAAGNGATDRTGTNKLSAAAANRFKHYYVKADAEATADHFERKGSAGHAVVAAFLRFRPLLIHTQAGITTPDGRTLARSEHAYASPRQWDDVALIAQEPLPDHERAAHVKAAVGDFEGLEFETFFRMYRNAPRIADIIANPSGAPVPHESGIVFAVASAISRAMDFGNANAAFTYLRRLPVEFATMAITQATTRAPGLRQTAAFVNWQLDNQHVN